jgi:hypothetical protein
VSRASLRRSLLAAPSSPPESLRRLGSCILARARSRSVGVRSVRLRAATSARKASPMARIASKGTSSLIASRSAVARAAPSCAPRARASSKCAKRHSAATARACGAGSRAATMARSLAASFVFLRATRIAVHLSASGRTARLQP